ncbi:glycosyltransferase, partial [Glutamicibacter creatinolyticus]|uniref:glycosyltransferase n=1 Tax=Glutamicibacter creatinolyticus TaxID=162496 RepID=UPI0032166EB0
MSTENNPAKLNSLNNDTQYVHKEDLPEGRYFSILGEIAINYRGMTNVVMRRSTDLSSAKRLVTLLTLGHLRDYRELERELKRTGIIGQYVTVRNLYDDLASYHFRENKRIDITKFSPLTRTDPLLDNISHSDGSGSVTKYLHGNKQPIQRDHYRKDGSLLISHVFSDDQKQIPSVVFLCDQQGCPQMVFDNITELRYFWLDQIFGESKVYLFTDSFRLVKFIANYQRKNVSIIQTVHNNMYNTTVGDCKQYISSDFFPMIRYAWKFDALIFLTVSQRKEYERVLGVSRHSFVVPNSRSRVNSFSSERDKSKGVMLAKLDKNKRPEHAVEAVRLLRDNFDKDVSLSIYGEGSLRPKMERMIKQYQLEQQISLAGYDPSANKSFLNATFSLLTSKSEALGLVLVESMMAGCIPIAYDVDYGPADIIQHGVNGFLVESGNQEALAACVAYVLNLDEESLSALRAAAVRRATDFSPKAVCRQWARILPQIGANAASNISSPIVNATQACLKFSNLSLCLRALHNPGCKTGLNPPDSK